MEINLTGEWFQQRGSSAVTGRFTEISVVHGGKSREAGKPVWVTAVGLETKVAGSRDLSVQLVKRGNVDELRRIYPEAYAAFGEARMVEIWDGVAAPAIEDEEIPDMPDQTPLTDLKGVGKERAAVWRANGILSMEMLADLADDKLDELGLFEWRKKARTHLGREG